MDTYAIFAWFDKSALGEGIRGNTWSFPLIEVFHIFALAVLLGSLFLIDMRLLGVRFGGITASRLGRELNRYMNWSIVTILISGTLLFTAEAVKAYDNDAFTPKVVLILLALMFHYTVHRRALQPEKAPAWAPLAALISLGLWFGAGAAGRAIGFV